MADEIMVFKVPSNPNHFMILQSALMLETMISFDVGNYLPCKYKWWPIK